MSNRSNNNQKKKRILQKYLQELSQSQDLQDKYLEETSLQEIKQQFQRLKVIKDKNEEIEMTESFKTPEQSQNERNNDYKEKEEIVNANNQELFEQLKRLNKHIENVESDGNCLYRAVSYSLLGDEQYWIQIKQFWLMLCYLQFNQIVLREEELNFSKIDFYEKYIQPNVWGDIETKGLVLSKMLKRKVCLWIEQTDLSQNPQRIYGESEDYDNQPLLIYYNGSDHFKAIVTKNLDQNIFLYDCLEQLTDNIVDNFFEDFVYYLDLDIIEQIDVNFYQDVGDIQKNIKEILKYFSRKFKYNFCKLKRDRASQKKNTHRRRDEMMEIFQKLGVTFINLKELIQQKIKNCEQCQQENVVRKRVGCKQIVTTYPFERVQIDCCELHTYLQQNGYWQILVIRDHFSRFTQIYPLKNKESKTIADHLQQFLSFGIPVELQSDNGKEFKNQLIEEICNDYNINFIHGRPYHPQSQGSVERINGWIHPKLVTMKLDQGKSFNLKKSLLQIQISYNQKKTRITGMSPSEVIKYKKEDDQEVLDNILSRIQNSFTKNKSPLDFVVNSKALLSNQVEIQPGTNKLILKKKLKSKSGKLHLYNIPVTISEIKKSNLLINVDKESYLCNKDTKLVCPVAFLKQVQDQCWEKFVEKEEKEKEIDTQNDSSSILDLDELKELNESDEEEYDFTSVSDINSEDSGNYDQEDSE